MKKLFVLLAAVAFVVVFTAPTFAAEWSFYGSARIHTFWVDSDLGDSVLRTGDDDDLDLVHILQGNSRIGANVKVTDNLTGRFEYGSGPNLRILWGEYDNALEGMTVEDEDVVIPLIEAGYSFKIAGLSLDLAGGYQTYSVEDINDNEEDVISYIVAIGGTYNMGPFYFGANYWMGRNVGNMNMWNDGFSQAVWNDADEDLLDTDGYGFILVGAFTLSDMLRFEAGYGYSLFDTDDADEKDDTSSYYVQATITFAKGVFIVPEIGKIDYGDDPFGDDEGDDTYYGLKWQINF
jgi:hypothetical protein